ncbi:MULTISPECIES: NAD-dependent epimerase/dehydratase family protein [Rhizobium]|uniref:UDP-glucose 4-epimerase n=1 Tax=Rhizobium lentis TaxID=1138194 RepID=A0A7W8UNA1_9HYPH|nr:MULTISPECIES: NAD-dependent epimerase/dehydratase family protein [Rhizobium]MBB4574847.1 UDP-glucose 4-epimerase [Rhizobium lentis]MBB5550774.1 UDP-glucose 4-epimerase [Rhizobium lentis]MBB5561104.1 UDP-glucose 4-epimerase [Rhizobium lentis]MBB5567893.1 UDP-glucose 4-epimerase [Rhizobium lentis]MEB3044874.1 NAD-dependent epimerase/dehydratase family protein [Rhizobium sp. MJ21]
MKNKRVLITGGAGLIGSHIADLVALEKPREIIILDNFVRGRRDNLSSAIGSAPLNIIDGDIRDRALLAKAFDGVDIVFHQAAIRITQCAEEPRLAFEVLAEGTFNVLEAAVKAEVSKVVAASSASVLGLAESFPTTEEHHPYNNRTIYGAAKTFNEGLLRSFADMYGLRYVALRYFNVYGPRMDVYGAYTEVLIRWMERLAAGMPPLIYGDGSQTMDFVDARDIARANVLAAKSDVTDEVFNVASGREISLLELAQMLSDIMGSSLEPQHKEARTVNGVTRRLADISKAERLLGFKAEISMEQGLRDLVAWWQSKTAAGGQAA